MHIDTSKTSEDRSQIRTDTQSEPDEYGEVQQRTRLLIVEDYDGLRESLQLYFQCFGYIVAVADSYRTAMKEAAHTPPDVLICDWHINGRKDGTDVAREIYQRYGAAIIFVSGSSITDLREATTDLGSAHYFRKPASANQIAEVIKAVEHSAK